MSSRARWTPHEDATLSSLVAQAGGPGAVQWSVIAEQLHGEVGIPRNPKQVRTRYKNQLQPGTKRGDWSTEELRNLLTLHRLLGNSWSKVAARMPSRQQNDVKNRWYSCLRQHCRDVCKIAQRSQITCVKL